MTPSQNLWLTIFNFGPAIVLGVYKSWWVGLAALVATFALSWVLLFAVTVRVPVSAMSAWAWLKPPIVAAAVLWAGWTWF